MLRTFPPDRGGHVQSGIPALRRWLLRFPTSDGSPVKKTGEFAPAFSPAFRRLSP